MRAPVPPDDAARVAALHRLGVLDQPPSADFEALTRLAVRLTGAGAAVVNLLDADRQWPVGATGMPCRQVDRDDSMCAHTVAEDALVHVPDARLDARFADNPFVTGVMGEVRLYVGVPLHDVEGYPVGTLCVVDPSPRLLTEEQLALLQDLARQAELLLELHRQHRRLLDVLAEVDHYATHDPLTGLVNRRLLVDRLEQALTRAVRSGTPPTVFFCDLDGFKAINDTHGHDAGDDALVAVARRIRASVRPSDTVARLGGDEFVVVCEDLPVAARDAVGTRLRSGMSAGAGVPTSCEGLRLSVGVCTPTLPTTAPDVLRAADALMYEEKQRRRLPAPRRAPAGLPV